MRRPSAPVLAVGLAAMLSSPHGAAAAEPMKVLITGAGGQTAGHVFRKMLARPELFAPVGVARTPASREALLEASGAKPEQVVVADVTSSEAVAGLAAILAGFSALVIGTSAKVKPTGGVNAETGRPNMGFPDGQPYEVDWLGQRQQIDAAKQAGVRHVVICSSMGGTNPAHMLNNFGRNADGSGGNILQWKRKAEKYLMDSGLSYTIVHPGGLLNEPGGRRQLRVGVDDNILGAENRSIPREDVAEVLLQSLVNEDFKDRSFDLISDPDSGAPVATDFAQLLQPLNGANCDYGLGAIPDEAAEAAEARALRAAL